MSSDARFDAERMTIGEKLRQLNWGLVALVCITAGIGFMALYSAANGSLDPWASRQMTRFALALWLMLAVALVDLKFWMKLAWPAWAAGLVLLLATEIAGHVGMGAQRWIALGPLQIQPSELMKIAVILALARWFHGQSHEDTGQPLKLIAPALMVLAPVGLVLLQPNLGTATILCFLGACIFFIAGVRMWKFILAGALGVGALPVTWHFMHDYQKSRVLTFLNPERDPLGAGYHITQSKIAFGSGGVSGKGFLNGTQAHLNFLPEKQTDFIFTLMAEEWGLTGALLLLTLFAVLIGWGFLIGLRARSRFARITAIGLSVNLFAYVFINVAMVTGLIPVVGIPLPLISYGGTSMLAVMIGFGLLICCWIHRDAKLPRHAGWDD